MAEDTSIIQSIINDLKVRMLYQLRTAFCLEFACELFSTITDFLYVY